MRCLIIDNYDSFTWNLADYVAQIFGSAPLVVRNDQYTWSEIAALQPFDCIIVSPGPGSVVHPADFNVSRDALEQNERPVFGVCLGHQGLAHIYGGRIAHAPVPFHGRQSGIRHDGSALFKGIPDRFEGVRYHSLVVAPESLPGELIVTARTDCGLIMGLQHRTRPKWGVQFHPESILTEYGKQILANFRDEAARYLATSGGGSIASAATGASRERVRADERAREPVERKRLKLFTRKLAGPVDAEAAFLRLYAAEESCFWLDSQSAGDGMSRFSFMGSAGRDALLVYSLTADGSLTAAERHLSALERELESAFVASDGELPFEFRGGYVGFMTYEMKAAFGATTSHRNAIPDSAWLRVDRFVAFDHQARCAWLVAVGEPADEPEIARWMDDSAAALRDLPAPERSADTLGAARVAVAMEASRDDYLAAIDRCKEQIVDGESYEVCLTNRYSFDQELDPIALYRVMRRGNPAPFGAFIKIGTSCILSTSPERFLKVDAGGTVQTRPIKGTMARSDDPHADRMSAARLASSEKDRAENLMIVDLMRNDLGRVSLPGSVTVPKLMEIESFKTVHQMVSTVESRLKPECTLIDLLRAVFPGGSITGAPKIRTMEIIDRLERSARGIYCGTIGYLGYNAVADLNIAIRTASYDGKTVRFGAGGAVTYLSDPGSEFAEVMLKAEALLRPIGEYLDEAGRALVYELHGRTLTMGDAPDETKREADQLRLRMRGAV